MSGPEYGILLPLSAAAEVLGLSIHTMRQWVQRGLIESHKLRNGARRISEDELIRIIEQSRQPARKKEARPRVPGVGTQTRGR